MTREDIICWLDLETTGSDPASDILEVGIALTTHDPSLTIIREYTAVVRPRNGWDHFLRDALDPVVIAMHTGSGLFDEVETAERWAGDLQDEIIGFLGAGSERIPLAGSGVSHFDRQFVRRDMPRVDKRLSYWAYDVGVVRRFLRLAGKDFPPPPSGLTHRALQDVRDHIAEARLYLGFLSQGDLR